MIDKVEKRMKEILDQDKTGHDFPHSKRVFNLGMRIAEKEGGDKEIIGVSCLVHDAYRPFETKELTHTSDYALFFIQKRVLEYIGYPIEKIPAILEIVKYHEDYPFGVTGNRMKSPEGLIVQDADRLDAMGAIGIARCIKFTAAKGGEIYDPTVPLKPSKKYNPDIPNPSAIHHFPDKLLNLKKYMNTAEGKRLAEHRHDYMVAYLREFFAEWDGKL